MLSDVYATSNANIRQNNGIFKTFRFENIELNSRTIEGTWTEKSNSRTFEGFEDSVRTLIVIHYMRTQGMLYSNLMINGFL